MIDNSKIINNAFTKDELEKLAKENPEIKAALIGADIKKIIAVAPKLVNFVI